MLRLPGQEIVGKVNLHFSVENEHDCKINLVWRTTPTVLLIMGDLAGCGITFKNWQYGW